MKVLHLINTLSAGGAELHLLTLCRSLQSNNVQPVVACLRERVEGSRSLRPDFERLGIKVIDLKAGSRYDLRFLFRIARVLTEEQPDILHTHLPRADLAGGFVKILRPSITWVSSVHGIYSEDWSGRWSLPLIRGMWRRANRVLCISHAVHDWLIRDGRTPHSARVIHYGIEADQFLHPRTRLREAWGLDGRFVVGSLGRLEPRKGHQYLIQAMPELSRRVPGALLLIAGHDPWGYGSKLRRLVDKLGLGDSVRLVGFQSDVPSFLSALDAFAFATCSEGFGQVMIEAMAAGTAVVASKVAPLTEIATDGQTALLVEAENPSAFADALARVLNDSTLRQQIVNAARARVQNYFTAERMTRETISLYEEVCGQRSMLRAHA
jgi:glycosyltransferase involved in cell wall biosynthesis